MSPLPPLTERIDKGAPGGHEFERLMHQLLLRYADRHRFVYEPTSGAGGDDGIDGLAPEGVPGLKGVVAFQFKWLWDGVDKGGHARKIRDSLARAAKRPDVAHWVLVTPEDFKPTETTWFNALPVREGLRLHHWGRERVESLLLDCPALFARYYPVEARLDRRPELAGYDGFDFKEFAGAYRKQVAVIHEHVRTLGLPPETLREGDVHRTIRLRDIFVPLTLHPAGEGGRSQSLAEALRSQRTLVVLGDPGTGKSTLLAFLALLHAGAAELPGFTPPSDVVPLLIPLRDFVRLQKVERDLSFCGYLEGRARTDLALEHAHRAFFEATLRMGEAVVLLDGLDEVGGAATRRRIAGAIRAFRASYPDCPLWVTSRVYGYTGDVRLPAEDFAEARLGRLDDAQIEDFIKRWYARHPNERERRERAKSLRGAVERTPSVKRLAGNPLLLTLMAFIHQGLRRLPQDRGELYEKCVEMLLKTWQEAKREEDDRAPSHPFEELGLHVNAQKDYLAHLALHLQEHGGDDDEARGLIARHDALACLVARHLKVARRTDPQLTEDRARGQMKDFLDYVSDRTGLLIDRGGGQLSFIHLSFQEYLAAWVFTCDRRKVDVEFFRQHLGDPAWEEVLLLRLYIILRTPGGGGADDFDRIVRGLLRTLKWRDRAALIGGKRAKIEAGWLTLVRALRDNLDFQPVDEARILRRAIDRWLAAPSFEGEWFSALEEICLFGSKCWEKLESMLNEAVAGDPPRSAVACLHLATRLLGFPAAAAERLQERGDSPSLLPDLVVFASEPGIGEILADAAIASWFSAFAALDSPDLYRLTLDWATGDASSAIGYDARERAAVGLLWNKTLTEVRSRTMFAALPQGRSNSSLAEPGRITVKGKFHELEIPLCGVGAARTTLRLQQSNRRFSSAGVGLLCRDLATTRLTAAAGSDEGFESALSLWASSFVSGSLQVFEPREGIAPVIDRFAHKFAHYFPRYLNRNFARNFAGRLAPLFPDDRGDDSAHRFAHDFAHRSPHDCARYFARYYTYDFASPFAHDFAHDFAQNFARYLPRIIQIMGVEPDAPDWETQWKKFLKSDENGLRVLTLAEFWLYVGELSEVTTDSEARPEGLVARLNIPFAIVLLLTDISVAVSVNQLFALGRHLAVAFPEGNATAEAIKEWLRRNPLDVYGAALAWEEHAKAYRATNDRLEGPQGALLLAHAAYAALMTGFSCDGPVWTALVADRDPNDPLIEIGYLLHEICHSRDAEQHARRLRELVAAAPPDCREVLDAAGIVA